MRCRTRVTKVDVDTAVATNLIRTHVMRPTWHLVAPSDVRWMLALAAPQMRRALAYPLRRFELDSDTCHRAVRLFERTLGDTRHLTRTELGASLSRNGIVARGPRLALLTVFAEIEAVICNGRPRGAQQTYALLSERVRQTAPLGREEAIGELTQRYLRSHAPATLRDFMWWSGLSARDAKLGLAINKARSCVVDGLEYWALPVGPATKGETHPAVHLLPSYDEYLVAYRDWRAVPRERASRGILPPTVVIGGQLAGTWTHAGSGSNAGVVVTLGGLARDVDRSALVDAVKQFGAFAGIDDLRVARKP